jgi:hypothetical protein
LAGFNGPTEIFENLGKIPPSLAVIEDASSSFLATGLLFLDVSEDEGYVSGDEARDCLHKHS